MRPSILLVLVAASALVYLASRYNRLVALRRRLVSSFARVDAVLRLRYDLVLAVVGASGTVLRGHPDLLGKLVSSRNAASSAAMSLVSDPTGHPGVGVLEERDADLGSSLAKLLELVDASADPACRRSTAAPRAELAGASERLFFLRESYNAAAAAYNDARDRLPELLFARPLGFRGARLFSAPRA